MQINDEALILALREEPERGLSQLMDAYTGYVYAVVRNRLFGRCPEEDIEEVVSDVFAALYRNRFLAEPGSPLKPYLAAIANRAAVDRYRRLALSCGDAALDDDGFAGLPSAADVEASAEENDRRRRLIAAVQALGEPDSTIVIRKYWLGETAAETARRTGLSPNAVTKRLGRALGRLRLALDGEDRP